MQNIISKYFENQPKVRQWNSKKIVRYAILALVGYKLTRLVVQQVKQKRIQAKWHQVCLRKKRQVDGEIAIFKNAHLNNFNLSESLKEEIINSSISGLKKLYFAEKVTIEQVLLTYIERCIKYATVNNWLADVCFEQAHDLAISQDEMLKVNKNVLYEEGNELFGIPVTIKDVFQMKGFDSTFGAAAKCFKPDLYDENTVFMIKQAGGIIFAKSNMPQIGYAFETNNFIFGRTKNPYNNQYITGGSSGGEGGLIAAKCSIIGIGNDLAGSIRIPSSFNGIYGYKPSTRRISHQSCGNIHQGLEGFRNIMVSTGPMGRFVDDLAVMQSVLYNPIVYSKAPLQSRDLYFKPVLWDNQKYLTNKKLNIGYFKSLRTLPSSAANQRAIDIAVYALQQNGHNMIEIKPDEKLFEEALRLVILFLSVDNLQLPIEAVQGEQMVPSFDRFGLARALPIIVKRMIRFILNTMNRKRDIMLIEGSCQSYSAYDYLKMSGQQGILQNQLAQIWDQQNLDALICPLTASVALKHEQTKDCFMTLIYAMIWNLFDYGCGVVPITTVQQDEQHYNIKDTFACRDTVRFLIEVSNQNSFGLPVSVQVVTQPNKDELCLNIMRQLEQSIQFNSPPQL